MTDEIEWLEWECPVCNAVHQDPNDFRKTTCKNGHIVLLGHDIGNGRQDAHDMKEKIWNLQI